MQTMLTCADLGAQETQPQPRLERHPFQMYLDQHQLSWSVVAREARVPCLIVWSIAHGVRVQTAPAAQVRVAVHHLSGVAYTGPMNTDQEVAQEAQATGALAPTREGTR
jgi:hypothetical protein